MYPSAPSLKNLLENYASVNRHTSGSKEYVDNALLIAYISTLIRNVTASLGLRKLMGNANAPILKYTQQQKNDALRDVHSRTTSTLMEDANVQMIL